MAGETPVASTDCSCFFKKDRIIGDPEMVKANAELPAAAPELFAKLESAVNQWPQVFREDQDGEINGCEAVDWLCQFVRETKDLLAKHR